MADAIRTERHRPRRNQDALAGTLEDQVPGGAKESCRAKTQSEGGLRARCGWLLQRGASVFAGRGYAKRALIHSFQAASPRAAAAGPSSP